MTNEDYELTLFDRLNVIRDTITKYGEDNFYISFSGGKDSTVLHYLIDMALPNNKIPRVFANTGIEYNDVVNFVKSMACKDERIQIIEPSKKIKSFLQETGYPFKSKNHSEMVRRYQKNINVIDPYIKQLEIDDSLKNNPSFIDGLGTGSKAVICYLIGRTSKNGQIIEKKNEHTCPSKLIHQFNKEYPLKISDACCIEMKEKPVRNWAIKNNKKHCILGVMREEGGRRQTAKCIAFKGKRLNFQPLAIVSKNWEEWFINKFNIQLCRLYYQPYNFRRTGCKGCPFTLDLDKSLKTMEALLPTERSQCELIWRPVYEEYRRLGYRLKAEEQIQIL